MKNFPHPLTILFVTALLAGCAVGPTYERPAVVVPPAFKEAPGEWVSAMPSDAIERGAWWEIFGDTELNGLMARVEVSNQDLAAAVAAYAQARSLVAQQRAGLFPSVSLNLGANRTGGGGDTPARGNYQVGIGASWEPDVWGRLGRTVDAARAGEQASLADLAAARLAIQGELAASYFGLRAADAQRALLALTREGYQRTLEVTRNRYNAGIAGRTDVLQAETQLASARADELSLDRQRAQLEHAIAVLVGQPPANFSLPVRTQWQPQPPEVPGQMPSRLLERRPDIAGAERRVAQANEQIGIAQSGYFPSLSLSGSAGSAAARLADLTSASSFVWAFGAQVVQSVFNAGATGARVDSARAAHEQAVARYRQTVLSAFQDVEDQLVAQRVLREQLTLRQQASQAADQVEQQVLNRYKAGQVGYAEVIAAQVTAQTARRALVQVQADRMSASVALVQALGGGWGR